MNAPKSINCWLCGDAFQWVKVNPWEEEPHHCEACAATKAEREMKEKRNEVAAKVKALTHARYQATDIAHPDFNLALWDRVKTWRPSPDHPWLGMTGPTGESKTRCAFLLLREIALAKIIPPRFQNESPRIPSIAVANAYKFGEAVADQFTDDRKAEAVGFLHRLRVANILVMDDLGKQANTSRVSRDLFALLDSRHEANLTTIWTSNLSPEGIVAGMPDDLAAPLAGRIRECSTIINLA